jgi:hypothetical protein
MRPIVNGTRNPFRTSKKVSYDPNRGLITTEEWESAGDGLSGMAKACIASRTQYDLTPSERSSKITFTSSAASGAGVDIPVDTWQILANETSRDVREHPFVLGLAEDGPGSLRNVNAKVEAFNAGEPIGTPLTGSALSLFNMLTRGVTSYGLGQYVLRHTTNVSNRYASNIADSFVEHIYDTNSLVTEITNASAWAFPCPGRLVYKIRAINQQIDNGPDWMWGWRKLPSTETTAPNNRIEITTEYWLGSHNLLLYPER